MYFYFYFIFLLLFPFWMHQAEGKKYYIPKNRLVFVSPYMCHYNPEVFPNPEVYDPERWSDQKQRQSLIVNRHFVEFGFGPHRCLVSHNH